MKTVFSTLITLAAFSSVIARAQTLTPAQVPEITPSAGSTLQELVGQNAALPSGKLSIALFTLKPGISYPESYNKTAEEFFLIKEGHGTVWLEGTPHTVKAGDIVRLVARSRHRIAAAPQSVLRFYALTAPPFQPSDYVQTGKP
ncbi:cupin domain-containing protein [Acetobacter tropicalis]|uniref:Cupin type-2 domain-containing protein n=1 Tax=Acetobacter tropicalis TaxID=104102 RepID=A0A095B0F8_9PROT|nr:cupin domain-containing protein [Acetobacter tropicalis]KAA8390041.1 cupin domain-containing protein [Acetobacter tropicalis]KAA8392049.1 cupin domain-containing protein [Acetobacter tropicalis]KGB22473.1 hypothetical protein AtDm6_2484 [Acetobacter tropicalis]MBC9007593.1 cupin domain-containing protein [Acetobacter tropicalis]MDO8172772.1 cupin domain-containing protein [Acetobacter tropicalis]